MKQKMKQLMMTLVALIAVTTGAWAQTGENIFQYCYDCQRNPAYPKTTASASLSGFANPLVGYKGIGFDLDNTSDGPWKLEYMGLWSTTDKHGIDDISNYQSTYNCTDVPVFRLYQWNATANEYQHAAYGVVCAYAKVSNAIEHTAMFVAEDGWGCVLTNSSHSSSMNITFDEDLTTGLATLIAAATPAASGTPVPLKWDATAKTATLTNGMPAGNVTVSVEYFPKATADGAVTAATDAKATTDAPLVTVDATQLTGAAKMMYYVSTSTTAPAYDAEGWTDVLPTAKDYTQAASLNVWYYPVGTDEGVGGATATYSDGDMNATALAFALGAAPTYTAEFDLTNAPEEDKAEGVWTTNIPEGGVVKGTNVTVTYSGTKKVIGVKVEKKGGAADPLAVPLTIEAITAGSINVANPKAGMQYSLDGGATKNAVTTGNIALNAGDKVQFYGNGTSITSYGALFPSESTKITGNGDGFTCKVYGNIMSLVDEENFATAKTLSATNTFRYLFSNNTTLTDASGLLLPATELAASCYHLMFQSCTALTAAPALPATQLAENCYRSMFNSCTALTAAPALPAPTLVGNCYNQMFTNCPKLATVTCLATSGINQNNSTYNWLQSAGSEAQGTKTVNTVSTAEWPEGSNNGIPNGWTRVNIDN